MITEEWRKFWNKLYGRTLVAKPENPDFGLVSEHLQRLPEEVKVRYSGKTHVRTTGKKALEILAKELVHPLIHMTAYESAFPVTKAADYSMTEFSGPKSKRTYIDAQIATRYPALCNRELPVQSVTITYTQRV